MTIYYTAKDIEEIAARGIRQLEVGPGVTLTDFARETAQQLNIALVKPGQPAASAPAPAAPPRSSITPANASDKYNKPSGCQHGAFTSPAVRSQAAAPPTQPTSSADSVTVNKLIDLMGKVIKRGD